MTTVRSVMTVAIAGFKFLAQLLVKMEENHKKVIDKHMVALVNNMDVFNVAINLQSKLLFSDHDVDSAMASFLCYVSVHFLTFKFLDNIIKNRKLYHNTFRQKKQNWNAVDVY